MRRFTLNPFVLIDLSWWHWLVTVVLLIHHLAGETWALPVAIYLCAAKSVYLLVPAAGGMNPFPVQVRLAYLGLLVLGLHPDFLWLHWVQLVGTMTMITVGYCPLARLLMLLPCNHEGRLSADGLRRILFSLPESGGLWRWSIREHHPDRVVPYAHSGL